MSSNNISHLTQTIRVEKNKTDEEKKSHRENLKSILRNGKSKEKKVKINEMMSEEEKSDEEFETDITNANPLYFKNEMKKELDRKDMEIKELREKLENMTIEKMKDVTEKMNILILNDLVKEVRFAENFLRSVMSESIFHLISLNNNTESYEGAINAMKDVRLIDINKRHMANCICILCLSGKGVKDISSERKNKKKIPITENIFLEVTYKPRFYEFRTDNSKDDEKVMTFEDLEGKKKDIRVKVKKESNDYLKDLNLKDFQKSMIPYKTNSMGKTVDMSLSSMIISAGMRNLANNFSEDSMSFNHISESDLQRADESCFKRFYLAAVDLGKEYSTDDMFTKRKIHSVSDLSMEEEALLLTRCKNDTVYIRKFSDNDLSNHISFNEFENSINMKVLYLVSPTFRNVKFYSSKRVSMVSNEEDDFMVVHEKNELKNHMEELRKEYPDILNLDNSQMIRNHDGTTNLHFYCTLTEENDINRFREKFWNMGEADPVVQKLANSYLAKDAMVEDLKKLETLFLFNMSFKHFCTLAFYWSYDRDFFNSIVMGNLSDLRQTINILPSFLFDLCSKKFGYYNTMAVGDFYNEVEKTITIISELEAYKTKEFRSLYNMMKFRCYYKIMNENTYAIMMHTKEKDQTFSLGDRYHESLDQDFQDKYNILRSKARNHNSNHRPINTFSPTKENAVCITKEEINSLKRKMFHEFHEKEEENLLKKLDKMNYKMKME